MIAAYNFGFDVLPSVLLRVGKKALEQDFSQERSIWYSFHPFMGGAACDEIILFDVPLGTAHSLSSRVVLNYVIKVGAVVQ